MRTGVIYNEINTNNSTAIRSGATLIAKELELLLNMSKHDLFFGNNMGIDLERYLYLRNRQATYHLIRDDIVDLLRKYGKVNLRELSIVFKSGTLEIYLTVEVKSTLEVFTVPLILKS